MRFVSLWTQSRLNGSLEFPEEQPDIEAFGGSIKDEESNVVRLAVHNTNGFHFDSARSGAEEIDAMETLGIDLLGLTETNVNWKNELKKPGSSTGKTSFWIWIYSNGIRTIKSQALSARGSSNDGKREKRRKNPR